MRAVSLLAHIDDLRPLRRGDIRARSSASRGAALLVGEGDPTSY